MPWATWGTTATGRVTRLAPRGAHGAQPHPEGASQHSSRNLVALQLHQAGRPVPVGDLGALRGHSRCRGPGKSSVHRAGPSARGQAGVCSTAGEGPELWRSSPPSPVGTVLTLAGLGHVERRRGRGRGGRPQTSVEREPNCKIQRQEPPDCRWGPARHRAPRPRSPGLWSRASAGQQDRHRTQWPVVRAGDSGCQGGPESSCNRPSAPATAGLWDGRVGLCLPFQSQALSSRPGLPVHPAVTCVLLSGTVLARGPVALQGLWWRAVLTCPGRLR